MRHLSFVSVLVLILSFATFAQTNETLPCPEFSLEIPGDLGISNEPIIYSATVGKEIENYNVKYNWTVINGKIIEGQGSLTIKVLPNYRVIDFKVTLEVAGLPKDCPNVASEATHLDYAPPALLLGEIPISTSQIEKTELFEKLITLDNDPTAQLYIIFRHKRNTSPKSVRRTEQKLFDSLIKAGIQKDRITFVKDSVTDESIQFWLVPAGAENPKINN